MNIFDSCLPKRIGSRIYLPAEDEDDFETSNIPHRNCFSCCLRRTRGDQRGGLIRLPEGARRTIDDYLDPRSPVSIEVLLAEQEEELDHYMGQTDDEDAFDANNNSGNKRKSAISYSFMDEEDAQFLSEHRISAILVDRPKLSSALVFNQDNSNNLNIAEDEGQTQQELLDVAAPAPSASTSTISSRVFAIKVQPKEDDVPEEDLFAQNYSTTAPRPITDVKNISCSPKELQETNYHMVSSPSSTALSVLSIRSTAENNGSYVHPTHLIGSTNSLAVFPTTIKSNSNITSAPANRTSDFPATTLTRTPYQPPPPMQYDIIPPSIHTTSSAAILNNGNTSTSVAAPIAYSTPSPPVTGRRPSVVAAAQSLLGDKLEDFTEKLAFIKKNIIMSLDSEDEEELTQTNHYYNTETLNSKDKRINNRSRKSLDVYTTTAGREPQHSSGSVEKTNTWDNFILPKFKVQSSASASFLQNSTQREQSQQQQQIRLPPRSTSIDHNNNAVPLSVTRENNDQESARRNNSFRRNSNASYASSTSNGGFNSEDEETFDFSKVVAMSKNVRTFGEGMMGNGLRMFNNLSTRIKNANHNENDQRRKFNK